MPPRQQSPRANRYKENSKGGTVLAVFLIGLCLLLVAGYLFHSYQQQKSVTQQQKPSQQYAAPQVRLSSLRATPTPALPNATSPAPATPDAEYNVPPPPPIVGNRKVPASGKAELAILVDDMGSSLQEARALAAIGVPINFAVIPGLRHDREVAAYAAGQGVEVLIHMPMQSKGYPQRRLEANGLLLEHSDDELRSRMLGYLEALPQAVGANNHMGSEFTEHQEKMRVVLKVLKEKKLFFVDSITSPRTSGLQVVNELKLRSARRDVFLDNEQNERYIRGQLNQAVARARKHGHAIAICHPHAATIATLAAALPELQAQGITLVKISTLTFVPL